jgi:hypothetical protein
LLKALEQKGSQASGASFLTHRSPPAILGEPGTASFNGTRITKMEQGDASTPQKGSRIMHPQHTISLSRWVRFVALSLLLGFGLMTSIMLSSSKAHAATTLTVSNCSTDSQLQADVTQANSDNAGDTINFSCSGDILLTQTLTISGSMTLDGSGQSVTLDGQNQVEVLNVNNGVNLTLNNLTIAHGSNNFGGGIDNSGTLTISNSTITNNSATNNIIVEGGGIDNNGTLTISNSTIANNSANYGDGGGIDNNGAVMISNSTLANNSAFLGGGLNNSGMVTISNSTIANNSAFINIGGLVGGIDNGGTVKISNSIVANNTGGNCSGGVSDQGYNLESSTDCGFTGTGSLQNSDPKLDPNGLQNNGGPTQTIALLASSPAIDTIPVANCPSTDQRGDPRPDNGETTCDMGAYEFADDNDLGLTNMPGNITTNATSPQGAVVTYTPPTVVDEDNPLPPVNCSPASGSVFPIGTTTVTCTVSDSDDSNSPVSQSFSVTVQPVLSVSVNPVTATEGNAFTGVAATGTAYGSSNPLTATITWGDGNSSTVSITPNADGTYSVSGDHTYAEEGSYALSVSVKDSGSLSASGNGTMTVSDAALKLTHFAAGLVSHLNASVAAAFTDADPNGQVSDYTAKISWGDGHTTSVLVHKNSLGKSFEISGLLHLYAHPGIYIVTLKIVDSGGSQLSKTVSVTVK